MTFNRDAQERPVIQATSLKGMVRSVLETVSNSCFGVFDDKFLDFRTTRVSKDLKPAIIKQLDRKTGVVTLVVLEKDEKNDEIAWLPAHGASDYDCRGDLHMPPGESHYAFAKVRHVNERWKGKQRVPAHETVTEQLKKTAEDLTPCSDGETVYQVLIKHTDRPKDPDGVFRTNKHDERVFFSRAHPLDLKKHINSATAIEIPLERVRDLECILAGQYTRFNSLKRLTDSDYPNEELRKRLHRERVESSKDLQLKEGDPVYYYAPTGSLALVLIPRMSYQHRIGDSLLKEFHPCSRLDSLCLACRIFGFVSGESKSSFRGKVSFSQALYNGRIDEAENPFKTKTLRVLGSPQPTSTNFYLINEGYENHPTVTVACGGYDRPGSILRGRKYYWQQGDADHPLPEIKYAIADEDGNRFNSRVELLMPGSGDKKRQFRFSVDFENLTQEELALLVWSLELEDGMYHRLGMGKPLGLGTVKIKIQTESDETYCLDHASIVEYYSDIECDAAALRQRSALVPERIREFKDSVKNSYGATMNYIDLCQILRYHEQLAAWIKYPKAVKKGVAAGFQWFAKNKEQPLRTIAEICGARALRQEGWEE
jgi:CRISPR-associated protein (TIGR03986 family)